MNPFERATISYNCASDVKIVRTPVKFPELKKFYFRVKHLSRALGDERSVDCWHRILTPLKNYRFNLCSAPLPPSYLGPSADKTLALFHSAAKVCYSRYPGFADHLKQIMDDLEVLFAVNENPLLSAIREHVSDSRRVGLMLVSPRNFDRVSSFLGNAKLKNTKLVSLTQLRHNIFFDRLVYVGSTSWLSDSNYIFSAPRSPVIHLCYYSWLKTNYKSDPVFQGASLVGSVGQRDMGPIPSDDEIDFDDIETRPQIDVQSVVENKIGDTSTREKYELAKARLAILSQSYGVFLDTDSSSTVMVINRSEDTNRQVRSLPVSLVRPGSYLVLKTSEDGDYIVPVADRILGELQSLRLRNKQLSWKALLHNKVKEMGFLPACLALIDHGSTIANESNLRNWLSPRGIKTLRKAEFAAIMKFVGLGNRTDEIWRDMIVISNAHRKAGFLVKRQMLEKLNEANIDKLEGQGKLTLELPGMDVGTLTAFRVESISDKIVEVPYSKLGSPFDLEDLEWQG